ncbi:MAG: hypothetical protein AAFN91_08280 [Pseudomonadota bacterium]
MTDPALESLGETAAKTGKLPKEKRHILIRLLGISWWGWIKLALLCILVGFFVMASEFDPTSPDVNVIGAIRRFLNSVGSLAGWAVRNFWKPALAGATIVLPLWLVWRAISLPFRK